MTFQQAVATCFSQYAGFSGRAARSEFWYWVLFYWVASIILGVIDGLLFDAGWSPLAGLFGIAVLVPTIAVTARRLHDMDRSGWWQLIGLIPILGAIALLIWLAQKGTDGPNRFGDDPLRTPEAVAANF